MRSLGPFARGRPRRDEPALGRRLVAGLLIGGASLLLTAARHEFLHVLGAVVTGGTVGRIVWLPAAGTLAAVDVTPPLTAGPAAVYVPLVLPYLADFGLIAAGLWAVGRVDTSSPARRAAVQHAVPFAALDVAANGAAAFLYRNDWALILDGGGAARFPVLVAVIAAAVAAVVVERRRRRGTGPSCTPAWPERWQPAGAGRTVSNEG